MRYLIALIPPKSLTLTYIQAAQIAFGPINDGYLLEENKSFPHITLCAFQCEETKLAALWQELQTYNITICPVRMMGLHLKKGKIPLYHYSVGITIARDRELLHLHQLSCKVLEKHNITCLNPIQDAYQPHLTLAGVGWEPFAEILIPSIIDEILDEPLKPFLLTLARGDDIGQYLETLNASDDAFND